ncbi:hypothetical protein ABBQ38_001734 [Trebouxia sp. C0009 RCD-2024]
MLLANHFSRCSLVHNRVALSRCRPTRRLGELASGRMYADREHHSTRHVSHEYKANAVDFGMGSRRERSRSPVARAVANPEGGGEIQVARRIYVGNLSYSVAWQDLKDHFKPVGEVVHADVGREAGPGSRSKGWGIVEFARSEDAAAAIEQLDRSELGGREIYLREDREDFELTGTSGGRASSFRAERGRGTTSGRGPASRSGVAVIGRRLFVNNLSPDTTWQTLKDYFRSCGNVVHTDVFTDAEGQPKGAGIVEYQHPDEALQAISRLTNTTLDGNQIRVREDREDADTQRNRPSGPFRARPSGPTRGVKDLKDLFKPIGGVVQADIVMGQDGRSRGWGTVNFETLADAEKAIKEMDGKDCEGRYLGVKLDKYSSPGSGAEGQEDMDMGQSPSRAKSERPSRYSASHKGRRLVVQGVPLAFAWQELKDLFKPLGAVKADIVMGSDRRSKGCGTVLFDSEADAENAIKEMDGKEVEGHSLGVKMDPDA